MSEQNKNLVSRFVEEVWSGGNFAVADELIAGDYDGHQRGVDADGPEGVKGYFSMLRTGFPDIEFTIEDQVAEEDRVATRWTACATHTGTFQGIPPTGKQGAVSGITINRVANGKIVEGWTNLDELGLMQQLGVIPAPAPAV